MRPPRNCHHLDGTQCPSRSSPQHGRTKTDYYRYQPATHSKLIPVRPFLLISTSHHYCPNFAPFLQHSCVDHGLEAPTGCKNIEGSCVWARALPIADVVLQCVKDYRNVIMRSRTTRLSLSKFPDRLDFFRTGMWGTRMVPGFQ